MRPSYLVIGAAKCATTSVCGLLRQHPDVFVTEPKETGFFAMDDVYARGIDWYEQHYAQASGFEARGEGSNRYTMKEVFPKTVARIVAYAPELKLVYITRNPIRRIESFWIQLRSHGGEDVHHDFNVAVRANRDWLVDPSNYWQQIEAYRAHFPDDRILLLFYEDFVADPGATMRRCFEFLDVDPEAPLARPDLHYSRTEGKKVPSQTLSRLRSHALFRATARRLPRVFKRTVKQRFFFEPVRGRPRWSPETRAWVVETLQPDLTRFLDHCGKPGDYWNLHE